MILSDKELRSRLVPPEEVTQAKDWWEKGDWDKISSRIVIEPFELHALGVCCYDLHVGEEYVSLRDPDNTMELKEGKNIYVQPSETVLILTKEYVCLPKDVMAMIVPRATWIFEGTALYATRIEPTWYGKLVIAFTNLAKTPIALPRGEAFCTCYWIQTIEVEGVLSKVSTQHLGRTNIGAMKFTHTRPQKLLSPDKVDRESIEKVVDLYGWPWDVVRGIFELTRRELGVWIEKEVSQDIVAEATSAAEKRAFEELTKSYGELSKYHRNLTIGVLAIGGSIAAAIVAVVIGYLIHLFT